MSNFAALTRMRIQLTIRNKMFLFFSVIMPFGFFSDNPTMGMSNPDFIRQQFPKVQQNQPDSQDPELEHQ